MPRRKASVQEIRLGALYKFGASRQIEKADLIALMTKRTSLKAIEVERLAHHWFTTEFYRARQ